MRKVPEVQEAKELMTEAMDWSTFKWLFEKTRVRQTAERADAALDRLERNVRTHWSEEIKAVHKTLCSTKSGSGHRHEKDTQSPSPANPPIHLLVEKVIEARHAAQCARLDAQATFDQAEKQLNVGMAREGCKKAIHAWELHEKAIRKAEAIVAAPRAEE